jgi:glycosyltransferase involved in cell wall biosynthesis
MRRVVHVGPTMAGGGMASVIHILAEHPPDGWRASTCNTFSTKGVMRKLKRWRIAKREIKNGNFDIVHIHCASDWSYKRKLSIAKVANAPVIFHIHSGKFDIDAKSDLKDYQVVCLSDGWCEKLRHLVGDSISVLNPVKPIMHEDLEREDFVLLMGRNDPVKGHDFAYSLGLEDLRVTGVESAPEGVTALGWVSEDEKWRLLNTAKVLIVPSKYEAQPMVILEALSVGCPVVASENVPDLPKCVKTAKLGDKKEWLDAIQNPITDELKDSVSMHSIDLISQQWGEIYSRIIESNTATE